MSEALDFRVETPDGKFIHRSEVLSIANVPADMIARLNVLTDDKNIPVVRAGVDPRKGQRLRMFTRHAVRLSAGNGVSRGHLAIVVLEIIPDESKPEEFVRLYLHPTQGPILSTEDLYF